MVLNRLPDDLKILVFHQLDVKDHWAHRRNRDLASVVHCCRRFYNLAIPILYSSFDGNGKARSVAFLRTILARPDLANYCRRLSSFVRDDDVVDLYDPMHSRPGSPLAPRLKGLKDALRRGCDDRFLRHRWRKSFSPRWCHDDEYGQFLDVPGNWDSITALLILLLPNISTLGLLIYGSQTLHNLEFLPYVFARASRLQALTVFSAFSLSQLRSVEILVDRFEQDLPGLKLVLPFLQLKSIREVNLPSSYTNGGNYEWHNDDDDGVNDFLPHITHLTFAPGGDIDSRALARFLRSFCGLTHFVYVNCLHRFIEPTFFNPPEIKRGLLPSKDSLQGLALVNADEESAQALQHDRHGELLHSPTNIPVLPLGCLLEFRKLRWLDVTAAVFLGRTDDADANPDDKPEPNEDHSRAIESLPEALEELTLRTCFPEIYTMMEILFARKRRGELNRLKKATLYFQNDFSNKQILQDRAGIQCEFDGSQAGIHVARHATTEESMHMFGTSYDWYGDVY
jgi:hypothetical protein